MKTPICVAILFAVLASVVAGAGDPATGRTDQTAGPVLRVEQIEADWLRQDQVRGLAGRPGIIGPAEDAAGGCDGVRNGSFGFHTGRQQDPWWQVDLGREIPIGEILVYNRGDANAERATRLRVLLSADGESWTEAYRHDGSMFGGVPEAKPLSILLAGTKGRFVRIQVPGNECLHLNEVEVFDNSYHRNHALGKPAMQSSASPWSTRDPTLAPRPAAYPTGEVLARGLKLAADLRLLEADVDTEMKSLQDLNEAWKALPQDAPLRDRFELYFQSRWAVRKLALANPLLDFDRILFVQRVPSSFSHMSDQYYGWFSRPGGRLCVLEDWRSDSPKLRCLTAELPPGDVLRPDISYDGSKALFAYCKFCPGLAEEENKLDKSRIPEDAFYHLYEINLDGSGLRRLTHGKYDDFDGRYLPNGKIVFLSTRRGQFIQCGKTSAAQTNAATLPDSYVRCGGGAERPVAVYTLHVIDAGGDNLRAISAFESFEWTPSVANDGRILYARWDYIDREAMPYMSLWSTLPDGSGARAVFGNYTVSPHAIFEARSIPNSRKLVFTASAHHAVTGGSLVLLDPSKGTDGPGPLTRLTPEVPFAEVEGWPTAYYANPYPLSEEHYLVAWSDQAMPHGSPQATPANAHGVYLFDAFGNLNLIYRDSQISSMYPLPIRPRRRPPTVAGGDSQQGQEEGRVLVLDVYQGLQDNWSGTVQRLRIVGVTSKTQPQMHSPKLGVTRNDVGKFVLGTAPVEEDGSAFFRIPSGMPFFLQALDAEGMAVQTMRSITYVQPGQTQTCVGCHESRNTAPANNVSPLASRRAPSRILLGPEGSWPLDFTALVQPVLDEHCLRCHGPGGEGAEIDLTPAEAYETLVSYGKPSLRDHVWTRHRQGFSSPGACGARASSLLKLLGQGHYEVELQAEDMDRLITWMDTYAQRSGSFSADQEERLVELRNRMAPLLTPR